MNLRRFAISAVGSLTLALAGCSPLSAPLPFHFTETAAALDRGAMRVTAAAGGGEAVFDGSAGGGSLRLRVGVGARQEVGFEGSALAVDNGEHTRDSSRWIGHTLAYGLKLSYKLAPTDWFAVVAGAGAAHAATGESAGGDLGLVFARPRGRLRP